MREKKQQWNLNHCGLQESKIVDWATFPRHLMTSSLATDVSLAPWRFWATLNLRQASDSESLKSTDVRALAPVLGKGWYSYVGYDQSDVDYKQSLALKFGNYLPIQPYPTVPLFAEG